MRLVRPFLSLLGENSAFPAEILAPLWSMDPDARLPIGTLHELMRGAIEMTGDEDLGLKATHKIERGDFGALEYAASSAATAGQAFEIIARYLSLVNDALRVHITTEHDRAFVALHSAVPLPRAAADYQSAAFARVSQYVQDVLPSEVHAEAWFTHQKPADPRGYADTFDGFGVRFDMPFNGFAFDASALGLPLPMADPKLNQLIRKHADALLQGTPTGSSFVQQVQQLLCDELPGGNPNALRIASLLGISARTLARRLTEEGTNFKHLLDELRRTLALSYVGTSDHGFSEIALLLGYTDAAAFNRAFRRWTEKTPGDYRRDARR